MGLLSRKRTMSLCWRDKSFLVALDGWHVLNAALAYLVLFLMQEQAGTDTGAEMGDGGRDEDRQRERDSERDRDHSGRQWLFAWKGYSHNPRTWRVCSGHHTGSR